MQNIVFGYYVGVISFRPFMNVCTSADRFLVSPYANLADDSAKLLW